MRKKFLIAISFLLLLIVIFHSHLRLGLLSAFFLWDLMDEAGVQSPHRGALAWITRTPSVSVVSIPVDDRTIKADLYHRPDMKQKAAILLTHGIIESGKDDPRLIRFALSLARCGFVVLVPELRGMKSLRILLSDVDDIVASYRFLRSLEREVDREKMGLMGFSYGAGPTFMAASRPSIRHQVKFVVSFGGYYTPLNLIRFITTGHFQYGDEEGYLKPEPYGKWVFFINNLNYVESKEDRRILQGIFREEQMGGIKNSEKFQKLHKSLSDEGRALYGLLVNKDPAQVEGLFRQTDARFRDYLQKISLESVVPSIDAYFLMGHGTADPLIPYTETLRLADAVEDESRVHLAILRMFTHVDPNRRKFKVVENFTVYLPSMFRFFYFVYDLLGQRE
ncbi:MAG: hypothetical protein QF619_02415 [Candidatus Binatia bacterium]|nr:hypothetical protein [Candidatus Binatia bacterium]